jgi:hypothetical protein
MSRTGKLARLPLPVQEQVNRRLQNNESSRPLLAWLNRLPEVRCLLAAQFNSEPITKQNLSRWRHGGFRDWLIHRQVTALANPGQAAAPSPDINQIIASLTARYYRAADACLAAYDRDGNLRLIRACCSDVIKLHRHQLQIRQLKVDQRLLALRERSRALK